MQNTRFVTLETCNAIFTFKIADAISHLKPYAEQGVREATELIETILETPSTTPSIDVTADYFGFIVLDLIKAEKGEAYCKVCNKIYYPGQLVSEPIGFGKSPFSLNLKEKGGIIKRLFSKRKQMMGMMGGEKYECSNGHELISCITWIT